MKKCCICDRIDRIRTINEKNYCPKHAFQIERHGKILKRTRFDPNEIVLYDNYAEIILYHNDGSEKDRTIIDLNDVDRCKRHKWHKKYCNRGKSYVFTRIDGKPIRLHRFVLDFYDLELEIDHIDGNPLDNRKENLRKVTHQENMQNQTKLPKNNTSGYIGVVWNKSNKKWDAQIKTNKKRFYLGSFEKIEDAVEARKNGEKKYFILSENK